METLGTYKNRAVVLIKEDNEYYAVDLGNSEDYQLALDDPDLVVANLSNMGPGELRRNLRNVLKLVNSLTAELAAAIYANDNTTTTSVKPTEVTTTSVVPVVAKPALLHNAMYDKEY